MEKIEGIIVQAFSYQDYDRIITLFTPTEGLIKLFVKGAFSKKQGKGNTTEPLTLVEALYTIGKSELFTCRDLTILNPFLGLRHQYSTLQAAGEILQAIIATQQPAKAAPDLYQLLTACLSRLPTACEPKTISASFRLKTLRHEGLLSLQQHCQVCRTELTGCYQHSGERFCRTHAPSYALPFSAEEISLIEELAFSRDFPHLSAITISSELASKISHLFETSIV